MTPGAPPKVLVAGIGNMFLSDDGFGVEVVQRLAARSVPPGVRVGDYGTRGVHLAYDLLEGYDALVLVDTVPMSEPPGTIAVLEADSSARVAAPQTVDAHGMTPHVVLDLLAGLGGSVDRVLVVGCAPAVLDEGIGLSEPVAAAVDRAVGTVEELLAALCGGEREESAR